MRFTRSLVAAFAMLAMASVAQATPISFSDTFDPTDQRFDNVPGGTANCAGTNGAVTDTISGQIGGACEELTYTHILNPPYIPLTDTLASALLTIYVYDDAAGEQAAEKLEYSLDSGSLTGFFPAVSLNGDTEAAPFVFSISVLTQVALDGTLVVRLDRQAGDLMFKKSELVARGERDDLQDIQTPQVPEPATLALLGLAAAVSIGRRRFV